MNAERVRHMMIALTVRAPDNPATNFQRQCLVVRKTAPINGSIALRWAAAPEVVEKSGPPTFSRRPNTNAPTGAVYAS